MKMIFGGRRQQHWHRAPGYRPADCRDTVLVFFGKGRPWPTKSRGCAAPALQVQYLESVKGGKNPGLPDHHGQGVLEEEERRISPMSSARIGQTMRPP